METNEPEATTTIVATTTTPVTPTEEPVEESPAIEEATEAAEAATQAAERVEAAAEEVTAALEANQETKLDAILTELRSLPERLVSVMAAQSTLEGDSSLEVEETIEEPEPEPEPEESDNEPAPKAPRKGLLKLLLGP